MLKKFTIIFITVVLCLGLSLSRPQKVEAFAITATTLAIVGVLVVAAGFIWVDTPSEELLTDIFNKFDEQRQALFGEITYDAANGTITGTKDVFQELLYALLTTVGLGTILPTMSGELVNGSIDNVLKLYLELVSTAATYRIVKTPSNRQFREMVNTYYGSWWFGNQYFGANVNKDSYMNTYTIVVSNGANYKYNTIFECLTTGCAFTINNVNVGNTFVANGYWDSSGSWLTYNMGALLSDIAFGTTIMAVEGMTLPAPVGSSWSPEDNHGPEDVYMGEDDWRFTGPNDVTLGGMGAALGGLWGALDPTNVRLPDIADPNLDPAIPSLPDIIDGVDDFVGDVVGNITDGMGALGTALGDIIGALLGGIAGLFGYLGNLLKQIYSGLGSILSYLGTMLSSLLAALLSLGTFIVNGISDLFEFDKTAWDLHLENLRTVIIAKVPCMTETTAAIDSIMETSGTDYIYSVTLLGYSYTMPMSTIFAGFENMSTFIKMFFSFGLWFAFIKGMVRRISTFLSGSGTQSDGGDE